MGTFGEWIILTPLVPALLILFYSGWQAFKEIRPTMHEIKSLQEEIGKSKAAAKTLIADFQFSKARATQRAEEVQELISYSRQTYNNAREVIGAVRSLDTLPARRAISYFKERQENLRLPKPVRSIKMQASKMNAKLHHSEFGMLTSLAAAILSATAVVIAFRRSS